MANEDVPYEELEKVRGTLVDLIKRILTKDEKDFLISFKSGEPDCSLLGIDGIKDLPAMQWKLINIRKIDEDKRGDLIDKLCKVLGR
jgi:hypothetical protein